jgi:glutamine amidotransferase
VIVVVDYCKGNLKSVERGLEAVGATACISADPRVIASAKAIVLPGVGSFADASETMRALGQMEVIRDCIARGVPFLGICLGLHLMFEEGTEGTLFDDEDAENASGLSILPGVVMQMPNRDADGASYKIPHVGWNSIDFAPDSAAAHSPLLNGIDSGEFFYFTHSYVSPDNPATLATTQHSIAFPSVVSYRDTAFGVQFHPEKSSDAGARVLRNFLEIAKGA